MARNEYDTDYIDEEQKKRNELEGEPGTTTGGTSGTKPEPPADTNPIYDGEPGGNTGGTSGQGTGTIGTTITDQDPGSVGPEFQYSPTDWGEGYTPGEYEGGTQYGGTRVNPEDFAPAPVQSLPEFTFEPFNPNVRVNPFDPYRPSGPVGSRDKAYNNQIKQYAQDFLAAPTRYDMSVVQEGMNAIRARMDELRRQGFNRTAEGIAGRGLLGSTRAEELQAMTRAEYDRQEQDQLFQLLREQAMTAGQDRALAGGFGLDVGRFGEQQYQFDNDLNMRQQSLAEQSRQFGADIDFRQRAALDDSSLRMRDQDRMAFETNAFNNRWAQEQEAARRQQDYLNRDAAEREDYNRWDREESRSYDQWSDAEQRRISARELELREKGLSAEEARWQATIEEDRRQWEQNQQNWQTEQQWRENQAQIENDLRIAQLMSDPSFVAFTGWDDYKKMGGTMSRTDYEKAQKKARKTLSGG